MLLHVDAVSDMGLCRQNNEDMIFTLGLYLRDEHKTENLALTDTDRFAAIVADGMGGHNGGEWASEIAVESFDDFLAGLPFDLNFMELKSRVSSWAEKTHATILERGSLSEEYEGMGTTFVGLFWYCGSFYWLNIGDSRLYLFRDGNLRQISTDHSMRQLKHDNTLPSNTIYNSLGAGESTFADFESLEGRVFRNDRFVVCSDGLSDMVDDEEIKSLMADNADAQMLVDRAKQNGGRDNVSVIVLTIFNTRGSSTDDEVVDTNYEDDQKGNQNSDQEAVDNQKRRQAELLDKISNTRR